MKTILMTGLAAAALAALPALASPGIIEAECHAQLNMPAGACACLGRTAGEELNDDEMALVVAMVTKDEPAAAELRGRMPIDQLTKAGMFMTTAPARCAGQ